VVVHGGPSYHLIAPKIIDPNVPDRSIWNRLFVKSLSDLTGQKVLFSDLRFANVRLQRQNKAIDLFSDDDIFLTVDLLSYDPRDIPVQGRIYKKIEGPVNVKLSQVLENMKNYSKEDVYWPLSSTDLDTYSIPLYYGAITLWLILTRLNYKIGWSTVISDISNASNVEDVNVLLGEQSKFRIPFGSKLNRVKVPGIVIPLAMRKIGSAESRIWNSKPMWRNIKKYLKDANEMATFNGLSIAIKVASRSLPVVGVLSYANAGNNGVIHHSDFPIQTEMGSTATRTFHDRIAPIIGPACNIYRTYLAEELPSYLPSNHSIPMVSLAKREILSTVKYPRSIGLFSKIVVEGIGIDRTILEECRKIGLSEIAAYTQDYYIDPDGRALHFKESTDVGDFSKEKDIYIAGHFVNISLLYLHGVGSFASYLCGVLQNISYDSYNFETMKSGIWHTLIEYKAAYLAVRAYIKRRRSKMVAELIPKWETFCANLFDMKPYGRKRNPIYKPANNYRTEVDFYHLGEIEVNRTSIFEEPFKNLCDMNAFKI
jgi:hypothetical protein